MPSTVYHESRRIAPAKTCQWGQHLGQGLALGQTGADEQGQTPQAFGRDDGPAWGGFRVADERPQRLAEWQIGIAAAHLGVAVAHHTRW
ncbi:MAG: hypothetical protein FJ011_20470 [Chloroflexi bacterium]|nr:hypothetical protein [Chloroflexota bacterium]